MKRKQQPTTPKDAYNAIKDAVGGVKVKLEGDPIDASLLQDLNQVSVLASLFSELRSTRPHAEWTQYVDELDAEGVNLWNITGLAPKCTDSDPKETTAALRLAAFGLVEAGIERKPGVGTLLRIIQLATKTASTCTGLDAGKLEPARSTLTTAAKYEGMLAEAKVAEEDRQGAASIIVAFLCCRMETAWKEHNMALAEFMSRKSLEHPDFGLLSSQEKRSVASKHHEIGKASLRQDSDDSAASAKVAVQWLQKAYGLVESSEDAESAELKISFLRSLARAYSISSSQVPENLARAEVALQELLSSVDATTTGKGPEYQELRWQRLTVLKQRRADDAALLEAYDSIIQNMAFSEATLTDILQDLRTVSGNKLVSDIHVKLIDRALAIANTTEFVDKTMISLIFHCSKDEDHHEPSIAVLQGILRRFRETEFEVTSVLAASTLTLFWKYGSQRFISKKWKEAADWFLLGSHDVFRRPCPSAQAKCLRKASLCHIEEGEYATAGVILKKCPDTEAATCFVRIMIAVRQGDQDKAMEALEALSQTQDFERKYLLVCTHLAQESRMRNMLLMVLDLLLKTLRFGDEQETAVQALLLIRCIIRLALKLLGELGTDKNSLIKTVVTHFQTAMDLVDAAASQNEIPMISKDVAWLWRTAYNTGVQGCEDWPEYEEQIAQMFEMCARMIQHYVGHNPGDSDSKPYVQLASASFSAVCARIFSQRKQKNPPPQAVKELSAQVEQTQTMVSQLLAENKFNEEDAALVRSLFHSLSVFRVEMLAQLKDWGAIRVAVTKITQSDLACLSTMEAISDVLWAEKRCPTDVLFACLEAVLHSSLDKSILRVDKFARWLRAVCTISLVKGPEQRSKAINYVEQALVVIEAHSDGPSPYPMEERQWLLSVAYNTGIEALQTSLLDDAKRWLEAATVVCRFVPDGRARADKISDTYARLLARRSHE